MLAISVLFNIILIFIEDGTHMTEHYRYARSVGKSSQHCDPVEVSGSFWNNSLVYKFVIH